MKCNLHSAYFEKFIFVTETRVRFLKYENLSEKQLSIRIAKRRMYISRGTKIFGSFRKRTTNHIPSSSICRRAKFFFSNDTQLNLEEMIMVCSTQPFGKSLVLSVSIRSVVCIVITHYNPSHASRVSHARFLLSCS